MPEVRIHTTKGQLTAGDVALNIYNPNGYNKYFRDETEEMIDDITHWGMPFYRQDVDDNDSYYQSPLDPSGWWVTRENNDDNGENFAPDGPLVGYITSSGEYVNRGWPRHLLPFQHRAELEAVNQLAQTKLPTNAWEDINGSGVASPSGEHQMFILPSPSGYIQMAAHSGEIDSHSVGQNLGINNSAYSDASFNSPITTIDGSGIVTEDMANADIDIFGDDFERDDTVSGNWGGEWISASGGSTNIVDGKVMASGNANQRCYPSGFYIDGSGVQSRCDITFESGSGNPYVSMFVGMEDTSTASGSYEIRITRSGINTLQNNVLLLWDPMTGYLEDNVPHKIVVDFEETIDPSGIIPDDCNIRIAIDDTLYSDNHYNTNGIHVKGYTSLELNAGTDSISVDNYRVGAGFTWDVIMDNAIRTSLPTGLASKDFVEITDNTTTLVAMVSDIRSSGVGDMIYFNITIEDSFPEGAILYLRKKHTITTGTSPWKSAIEVSQFPGIKREWCPYVFPGEPVKAWPINAFRQCFELLEMHTHYISGSYETVTGIPGSPAKMMIKKRVNRNNWPKSRDFTEEKKLLPFDSDGGNVIDLTVYQSSNPSNSFREPYVMYLDRTTINNAGYGDIDTMTEQEIDWLLNGRKAYIAEAPFIRMKNIGTIPDHIPMFRSVVSEFSTYQTLPTYVDRWNALYPDYEIEIFKDEMSNQQWANQNNDGAGAAFRFSSSGLYMNWHMMILYGRYYSWEKYWSLWWHYYWDWTNKTSWRWDGWVNGQDPLPENLYSVVAGDQKCYPSISIGNTWSGSTSTILNDGQTNKSLNRIVSSAISGDSVSAQHINQLRDAVEKHENHIHKIDLTIITIGEVSNKPQKRKVSIWTKPPEIETGYNKLSDSWNQERLTGNDQIKAHHINEIAASVMWLYDHKHPIEFEYDDIIKTET